MVASSNIVKMGEGNWTMWYEATPGKDYKGKETPSEWSVGIAHAKSPRGPWIKSALNPIINETIVGFDGFYVAAVMVVNGSIWMYAEVIVANDYGPLELFTAETAAGPYVNRGKVLVGGGPGSWDHTQYSESKVEYRAGVFHLFFSAGSTPPGDTQDGPGRRRLGDAWETTGYVSESAAQPSRRPNTPVPASALLPYSTLAYARAEIVGPHR